MSAPRPSGRALGVVGHGVSSPSTWRYMPERCGDYDHPGSTYNPWHDRTWCLCGEKVVDGNMVDFRYLGKGGLLAELLPSAIEAGGCDERLF